MYGKRRRVREGERSGLLLRGRSTTRKTATPHSASARSDPHPSRRAHVWNRSESDLWPGDRGTASRSERQN
ncbi:hypothetical protein GQ43DRAFT_437633, partial [Delitschia confertaspora ATCC 74209]